MATGVGANLPQHPLVKLSCCRPHLREVRVVVNTLSRLTVGFIKDYRNDEISELTNAGDYVACRVGVAGRTTSALQAANISTPNAQIAITPMNIHHSDCLVIYPG